MTILFFSNWGAGEGITNATVMPIVRRLLQRDGIRIILVTIEKTDSQLPSEKNFIHMPLKGSAGFIGKLRDLFVHARAINKIIKANKVDVLWCRGATAGGIGALAWHLERHKNRNLVVDSFEPHSQYMVSTGTWSRLNPKYIIQSFLEKLIRRSARMLVPVSYQYKEALLAKGVRADRIFVLPCVVNLAMFNYDEVARKSIRRKLNIPDHAIVGIYVGKFDGLYLGREAFRLYSEAFGFWKDRFYLMILTEADRLWVNDSMKTFGIPQDRVFVSLVRHSEIPGYLSASDFAFSTIKPAAPMRYCSAIKHGEYWAADLPMITTLPWGDDADILSREGGGVIVHRNENLTTALREIEMQIGRTGKIRKLAEKYRNEIRLDEAINAILDAAGYKTA